VKKDNYNVIGVMSGTSLDGIDLCWVKFSIKDVWSYKILATETNIYSLQMKSRLEQASNLSPNKLKKLDEYYTNYLANTICNFIKQNNIKNLDAVCSHGHTVRHEPEKGATFQIGNLPSIANFVKETIVCDFRSQDVALGGQGAPLVPVGDELLFSDFDFCINLGGFANISFKNIEKRIAFDICPVNTVLNFYSNFLGCEFDEGGKLSSEGSINFSLLNLLNSIEFYQRKSPKSLGIEWVREEIFPIIAKFSLDPKSILRTFVEHISIQISDVLKRNNLKNGLFTGGAVFNSFLVKRISYNLGRKIILQEVELINYKEALIFALLGVLRLRGEANCLSSVTGASHDHSSGKIYYPHS